MKRSERTISRAAAVAAAFLLALAPARGEAQCSTALTVGECQRQVRATLLPEAAATSPEGTSVAATTAETMVASGAGAESADLEAMPTGMDTGGATLQSTTKDLVPLAAIAALLGQGDGTNDQGDIVANLNFLLPGGLAGKNSQLQAVATTEPTLSAAVREALPETSRDDLASTLTEKISSSDQVAISFTYSMQGLNRGRSFELYRNRYRALVRPMVNLMMDRQKNSDALSEAAFDLCPEAFAEDEEKTVFADIAAKCGAKAELQARALIAAEAAAFFEPLGNLRASLTTKGFDRFGELVANQPQLHVSLTATEREPLVGADTTSGKLTYEWARVNLAHAMSEDCHRRLEQGGDPGPGTAFVDACAREYTSYVTAHAAEIAEGERISLTLEYESVESLLVPLSTLLPDAGVEDFRSPSSKTRIAKLGWSRNFGGLQAQPTRVDLVAGYEDVTDDPARRDRLVATATMNLKFGQMDVPFGIVYANHGKYLGEVDEQFSAHLGLKFDLKGLAPTP